MLNDIDANAIFGTIGSVGLSTRRSVLFRDYPPLAPLHRNSRYRNVKIAWVRSMANESCAVQTPACLPRRSSSSRYPQKNKRGTAPHTAHTRTFTFARIHDELSVCSDNDTKHSVARCAVAYGVMYGEQFQNQHSSPWQFSTAKR